MLYTMRAAPPPLDRFIETLWYWEGEPLNHRKDMILSSVRVGLLINLAEDRLDWYDGEGFTESHRIRGIGIAGPQARATAIDAFLPKMMGVQFRVGGAFPFFGPAMDSFADRHIALEDVWGTDAERLHQRLVGARTPEKKFDILQETLLRKILGVSEYHPAVSMALRRLERAPHRTSIAAVAEEAGLSKKKFAQIFSGQVGLRPKLYLRIARFQRVLNQIAAAPAVNWGDVAEENGYYDQSHFIRDFGDFSGLAPNVYLKLRGPHLQHVAMPI
jgi:AraC-like DNA-binding protein